MLKWSSRVRWGVVVGAGLAMFIFGAASYAGLFGRAWVEAHAFSEQRMSAVEERFAINLPLMVVGDLLRAAALAGLLAAIGRRGVKAGLSLGATLWIGISLPLHSSFALSSGTAVEGFLIDAAYRLLVLLLGGGLVGAWGVRADAEAARADA